MWDPSPPTSDQTQVPCIARWILDLWTTEEVPQTFLFKAIFSGKETSIKPAIMPLVGKVLRRGFPGGSFGGKNLSATWEVGLICQEDPLEKRMTTHFSILAWRLPWTEEPCRLPSMGSHRVGRKLKWLSTQQACTQLGKATWQLNEESICFLGKRGKCCHCDPLFLFFCPCKLCNAWSYSSLWGPSSCDDKERLRKLQKY